MQTQSSLLNELHEANDRLLEELSKRRQVEMALRESEERYHALFENNHSVLLLLDPETADIVDVNPAACKFYGYRREELIRRKMTEINTLTSEQVLQEMQRAKAEQRNHFLFRHRLASGAIRDVEVYSGPIIIEGRTLLYSIVHDITDRVQAEIESATSKQHITAILESISDGFFSLSRQMQITYFNKAAERLLGRSAIEVMGQNLLDAFPEFKGSIFEEKYTWALHEQQELTFETYFSIAPYENWYDVRVYPYADGISVYFQVTTEQKHAEEEIARKNQELAQNAALLQNIFHAAPIGIAVVRDREFIWTNTMFHTMTGYTEEELQNQNARMLYPDDEEYARVGQARYEQYEKYGRGTVETRWKRKDGVIIHVLLNATPLDLLNMQAGLTVTALDITEQKRAETERNRLFNYSIDMLCVAGFDGYFKQLNPAWRKTLGWTEEELMQVPWLDLVHPDDRETTVAAGQQLLTGQAVFSFENRYRCRDGSYRWIAWNSFPLPDERLIFGVARDMTEHKQVEAEIRQLNATLEERVRQRTAELEAVNNDLRDFVYAASHDLKTPLRGISRIASWLVQDYSDVVDEPGRDMADSLIRRVSRLDKVIDGMLEYASIGRRPATVAPIALHALVQEVIQQLAPSPNMRISVPDDLPVIVGEARWIRKLFWHLLRNAIQFNDKSTICITLTCQEADTFWTFSITDNGPGIEPKYHSKIFQMFWSLHPHDDVEHIGIGLAIVKKVVEMYGGKIWVESEVEHGTTFWFTFPKNVCVIHVTEP